MVTFFYYRRQRHWNFRFRRGHGAWNQKVTSHMLLSTALRRGTANTLHMT